MNTREKKFLDDSLRKCTTPAERVSVYYSLASRFYDEDRHKDAIPLYEEGLKLEKTANGRAYFLAQIGTCYYFLENDKEATSHLTRAKRQFKTDASDFNEEMFGQVHYYLGALYAFHGKARQALKEQLVALDYIHTLDREYRWLLHTAISRSYSLLGNNEAAVAHTQKALEVISDDDPNLTFLYESMGNNYFELGQFDEALKAYQKLLELDPKFVRREEIYGQIGHCYQNLTNYRSALEAYQKMLEVKQLTGASKDLLWLFAEIADCFSRLGDHPAALETARQGLKLRSRNKQEKAQLRGLAAISLYELGSPELSVQEGEKALKLSTQFRGLDQLLFRMAMGYHKLGDVKQFRRFQKWCAKSFPEHAWNKLLEKLA